MRINKLQTIIYTPDANPKLGIFNSYFMLNQDCFALINSQEH